MIYWTDISELVRDLINDPFTPYRFSNDKLVGFANSAIENIRTNRPSAKFDSNLQPIAFQPLSYGGLFEYLDTGSQFEDYHKITGWDRETYPTLYFKTGSLTQIDIYASAAHRTAGTPKLAHILQVDTVGDKSITADNASGFAGRIANIKESVLNEAWEVTAEEQELPIDDQFKDPMIYYISYKAYELDNEDTQNLAKSQLYLATYKQLMGIK